MFDELFESTAVKKKSNKSMTVFVSTLAQATILCVFMLIPLMYTEALPKAMLATLLIAPPPPPPPPPQPVKPIVKPVVRVIRPEKLMQPRAIPREVTMVKDPGPPPDLIASATPGGAFSNIPGQDIIGSNSGPAFPPPPKTAAPARIKQGGNVTAASIVTQTRPLYPALARQARIQGNVVLHAIIDKDGKVAQLEVISGHPLLVQSALDAVKQWRYKPTLLNGDPVEVDTTITVTFTMGG